MIVHIFSRMTFRNILSIGLLRNCSGKVLLENFVLLLEFSAKNSVFKYIFKLFLVCLSWKLHQITAAAAISGVARRSTPRTWSHGPLNFQNCGLKMRYFHKNIRNVFRPRGLRFRNPFKLYLITQIRIIFAS